MALQSTIFVGTRPVGAIAISIVGFSQLGWTTSSTSEKLAQERADTAVVAALVAFCVVTAQQDPDKALLTSFRPGSHRTRAVIW
jgi:hypothetical protein